MNSGLTFLYTDGKSLQHFPKKTPHSKRKKIWYDIILKVINKFLNLIFRGLYNINIMVHLVFTHMKHPTFLKLDSLSPGAGFNPIYIHQGNKSDKERKIVKKDKFYAYKKI